MLIKFNATKTWDEFFTCLEKTLPHVEAFSGGQKSTKCYGMTQFKFETMESDIKTEPNDVDVNLAQSRAKFSGTCFYCKCKGHKKRDCFKFKKVGQKMNKVGHIEVEMVDKNGL